MRNLILAVVAICLSTPVFAYTSYGNDWLNNSSDINERMRQNRIYEQQQEQQRQMENLRRQQETQDYYRRQQEMDNRYKQMNRKMF